ncbi:hypothetical protein QQF64_035750 [Cirrhinus molitorella]|uniref:Uncharacterized protein n=1 Tax=Cirrhinus molitorella TaxID=172907 RepID=A0ABR3NGY5_9TELE
METQKSTDQKREEEEDVVVHCQRAAPPEPSCVSMKSDRSINLPPVFSDAAVTSGLSISRYLRKYNIKSRDGQQRLLPAVKNCRKALFASCNLNNQCCEIVASALQSPNSCLRELDLSNNDLQDSGVKLLSIGLKSPNCKLEILSLSGCMLTEKSCSYLASALSSNPSHLRELDLSYNHPGESGIKMISDTMNKPNCTLNTSHGGEIRIVSGPRKYACDLTMDPNTAHTYLALSEKNKGGDIHER